MLKRRAANFSAMCLAGMLLAACAPKPPPAPPPAPPPPPAIAGPQAMTERTLLTMAADQTFPSGGYTLNRTGKKELDDLVPQIQAAGSPKITVYGYTDNQPVGKALKSKGIADNLDLSSKRAGEVVRYLTSKGIDPSKISAKGRGDTHPVAPNETPDGRRQNRRIEVVTEQPAG